VEVRVRRADGAYRWFQCSGLPLHDDAGGVVRWYSLLTDIEDRKITEEILLGRERDLALIVENHSGVGMVCLSGRKIYVRQQPNIGTHRSDIRRARNWVEELRASR
jgi:hypothetical protein